MQFAEISLAIMNATVSKISTEIFLENVSKQSKLSKIDLFSKNHLIFLSRIFKIAFLKS